VCDTSTVCTSLFDVKDVQYALASLKFGKAAGHDGLTKKVYTIVIL